jgi:hypothetical protein
MTARFPIPGAPRAGAESDESVEALQKALKNFRYIVATVGDDALRVWADLWKELDEGVTPGGMVSSEMAEGFKPACGWPEFLEKFWLLKHYLDCIHRVCTEP